MGVDLPQVVQAEAAMGAHHQAAQGVVDMAGIRAVGVKEGVRVTGSMEGVVVMAVVMEGVVVMVVVMVAGMVVVMVVEVTVHVVGAMAAREGMEVVTSGEGHQGMRPGVDLEVVGGSRATTVASQDTSPGSVLIHLAG